jgi:hypothetical protein
MQVYVDDPASSCSGTRTQAAAQFTIALLWATVLDYPQAWRKADGGKSFTWIGATIAAHHDRVDVSFPQEKCRDLAANTARAAQLKIIPTKQLQFLAGSVNVIAGIIHPLRPFLSPIWAALSTRRANDVGQPAGTPTDRIPCHHVKVRQCSRTLRWISLFLNRHRGALTHATQYNGRAPRARQISVDASPWGIGGVLHHHGTPLAYFADAIARQDATRFRAAVGDPAYNALLEALAILVALRCRRRGQETSVAFQIRSDSLSALSSIFEGSSRSANFDNVL